jgi:hypothetical protein
MAKLKEMEAAMVAYFEQHRAQASEGLVLLPGVSELLPELKVRHWHKHPAHTGSDKVGQRRACVRSSHLPWSWRRATAASPRRHEGLCGLGGQVYKRGEHLVALTHTRAVPEARRRGGGTGDRQPGAHRVGQDAGAGPAGGVQ